MEQYSKQYFKKLANQIMFDLSDEEIEELQVEFQDLTKQMELLDKIDTTHIEAMAYPFEEETQFLREDCVNHTLTQEEALANAPKVSGGQIVVPKVVK